MSRQVTPCDSSNFEFIFQEMMSASNPIESSPIMASAEIGSKDVFEVTPDDEEVVSTTTKGKGKGKEKGKEQGKEKGKGKATKWDLAKPHTSPRIVHSPWQVPQACSPNPSKCPMTT